MPERYTIQRSGKVLTFNAWLEATRKARNGEAITAIYANGEHQLIGHKINGVFVDATGWSGSSR